MSVVSDKSASKILSESLQRFYLAKILEKIFYPIILSFVLVYVFIHRIVLHVELVYIDSATECVKIALSWFW